MTKEKRENKSQKKIGKSELELKKTWKKSKNRFVQKGR